MLKKRALVTQQVINLRCFISPELGDFELYAKPGRVEPIQKIIRQFHKDIALHRNKKNGRISIEWERLRNHPAHSSPIWEAIAALQHIISSKDVVLHHLHREECFQVIFQSITYVPMVLGEITVFPYEDTAEAFAHFILPSGAIVTRERLVA